MREHEQFVWTPARDEEVRTRWLKGESATTIAEAIGCPSRSAVLGKAYRLGLSRTGSKHTRPAPPQSRRAEDASEAALPSNSVQKPQGRSATSTGDRAAAALPSPAMAAAAVMPTTIGAGGCKWPFGDPKAADFGFCGGPRDPALPYCPEHFALAHTAVGAKSAKELYRSLRRHIA